MKEEMSIVALRLGLELTKPIIDTVVILQFTNSLAVETYC